MWTINFKHLPRPQKKPLHSCPKSALATTVCPSIRQLLYTCHANAHTCGASSSESLTQCAGSWVGALPPSTAKQHLPFQQSLTLAFQCSFPSTCLLTLDTSAFTHWLWFKNHKRVGFFPYSGVYRIFIISERLFKRTQMYTDIRFYQNYNLTHDYL